MVGHVTAIAILPSVTQDVVPNLMRGQAVTAVLMVSTLLGWGRTTDLRILNLCGRPHFYSDIIGLIYSWRRCGVSSATAAPSQSASLAAELSAT
jgi:hypothetical protein